MNIKHGARFPVGASVTCDNRPKRNPGAVFAGYPETFGAVVEEIDIMTAEQFDRVRATLREIGREDWPVAVRMYRIRLPCGGSAWVHELRLTS